MIGPQHWCDIDRSAPSAALSNLSRREGAQAGIEEYLEMKSFISAGAGLSSRGPNLTFCLRANDGRKFVKTLLLRKEEVSRLISMRTSSGRRGGVQSLQQ